MIKLSKSAAEKFGKDKVLLVCLTNENLRLTNKSDMRIISLKSKKLSFNI